MANSSSFWTGYHEWVIEKREENFVAYFGLILSAVGIPFLYSLAEPGKNPIVDMVGPVGALTMIVLTVIDVFYFWLRRYRRKG